LIAVKRRQIVVPLLSQDALARRITMLAKKPLTDRAIATAKPAPAGKRRLLWDAMVPGLALRVTDTGKRTFVLVTRYPGSPHPAPRSLGAYGAITLAEARDRGREWLKLIATGIDPGARAEEQRQETLNAIASDYFARKAKDLRTREVHEATLARLVYTLHDLRRTARSLMSRAGVPSDHAERALGHVIRGVRGVYDRHEYHREKAQAFEMLAGEIERIVSGGSAKVVTMRGKRTNV
jgi:Arm DNA-binding domain